MARSPASPIHQRPTPPLNLGLFIMFVPDYAVISAICHTATSRCGCCGRGQLPKNWARQTKNINVLTKHTLTKNTRVRCTSAKCAFCFVFFVFGLKTLKRKPQWNVFRPWIVHRPSLKAKTTSFPNALEFTKRHRTTTMKYYTFSFDHATSLH